VNNMFFVRMMMSHALKTLIQRLHIII